MAKVSLQRLGYRPTVASMLEFFLTPLVALSEESQPPAKLHYEKVYGKELREATGPQPLKD